MPEQPRVFVSSTIRDFKDLRLALKFWLQEAGFQVFLSECNDFPVDPGSSAFENCLDVLRSCQYAILLVGYRRGGFYDEAKRITVTRAEYREAYERLKAGKLKLVACVRAEVEDDLRSGNTSEFDDFGFTEEFLSEIRRDEEVRAGAKAGGPFPKGNWVFGFREFRDLAQAIRGSFRIGSRLQRRAIEANLLWELVSNLKELLTRGLDGTLLQAPSCQKLQRELALTGDNVFTSIQVSREQAGSLSMSAVLLGGLGFDRISTTALDEAINSGEFLEYELQEDQFVVGELQTMFLELRREILALKRERTEFDREDAQLKILELSRSVTRTVAGRYICQLFSLANRLHNVLARTAALAAYFSGITDGVAPVRLAPETPLVDQVDGLAAERVTDQDVETWLLRTFGEEES
jgi:hypothetical protein